MSSGTADESLPPDAHCEAAKEFVERARSTHGEKIVELYVFGSTILFKQRIPSFTTGVNPTTTPQSSFGTSTDM
jgi:hypothetical protein